MTKLIIIIMPLILIAQDNYVFGPSIRVNDDAAGIHWHSATQRSIACRGDTVYMVWRDDRYGNPLWANSRVFFSKSTDGGNIWSPNLMISQDSDTLWGFIPHLALDALGNIYVAYTVVDDITSNKDIYFTKSTDGGLSFSEPIIVNDSAEVAHQRDCAIAVDSGGQNVYVVWEDWRNPQYDIDIYLARSTNGGLNFLPSVRVNDDFSISSQWFPVIACNNSGQNIYIAWDDRRDTLHNWDVYFSRSTDYGQTFEANYPINDTTTTGDTYQYAPSMYYKNGAIYVVWTDQRDYIDVFFAASVDGGLSFGPNVRVTDSLSESGANPSVTADDSGKVYVVWRDTRDFALYGHDIYFAYSSDSGETFSPNVLVNDHLGVAGAWDWNPSVCVNSEGTVFVGWDTDRNSPSGKPDIYCAAGTHVGIQEYYNPRQITVLICSPNPFCEEIGIRYMIHDARYAIRDFSLKIYDISGRLVKSFSPSTASSATQYSGLVPVSVCWDGRDNCGVVVPTGIYFVELVDDNNRYVKKIVKVK